MVWNSSCFCGLCQRWSCVGFLPACGVTRGSFGESCCEVSVNVHIVWVLLLMLVVSGGQIVTHKHMVDQHRKPAEGSQESVHVRDTKQKQNPSKTFKSVYFGSAEDSQNKPACWSLLTVHDLRFIDFCVTHWRESSMSAGLNKAPACSEKRESHSWQSEAYLNVFLVKSTQNKTRKASRVHKRSCFNNNIVLGNIKI